MNLLSRSMAPKWCSIRILECNFVLTSSFLYILHSPSMSLPLNCFIVESKHCACIHYVSSSFLCPRSCYSPEHHVLIQPRFHDLHFSVDMIDKFRLAHNINQTGNRVYISGQQTRKQKTLNGISVGIFTILSL